VTDLDDVLDGFDQDPPHAQIKRVGRWTYSVIVEHGLISWGPKGYPWHVLGRKRAERKARRVLRRYQSERLQVERWEIP
jgi:hypothetical protein